MRYRWLSEKGYEIYLITHEGIWDLQCRREGTLLFLHHQQGILVHASRQQAINQHVRKVQDKTHEHSASDMGVAVLR